MHALLISINENKPSNKFALAIKETHI